MRTSFTGGVQTAWDSTSIKLAETCPRKYQYKMIDGWQPRRKSTHLLFGGWYASALEHYHKYRALGDTLDEALVKVVREALINTWVVESDGTDTPPQSCPWQSDHATKTRENLIRTIIWYIEEFRDDPATTLIKSDGTPAVELSFSFAVTEDIILCGHLDRLVEYAGAVYVMDQKTTGSTITNYFFDQFDPDTQMSLYTYAGQLIYNHPIKGVILDAAQIAVGSSRFVRGFTFRDADKLDEWLNDALATIEQTQHYTEENYFPQRPSSCGNYGGCEFRGVCSRSPAVRENFLAADFVKGELWDPLKKR